MNEIKKKKNPAAVALGRLGRAVNSPAQREASRRNGQLGGSKRKTVKPNEAAA
jgi:hypothetical protein